MTNHKRTRTHHNVCTLLFLGKLTVTSVYCSCPLLYFIYINELNASLYFQFSSHAAKLTINKCVLLLRLSPVFREFENWNNGWWICKAYQENEPTKVSTQQSYLQYLFELSTIFKLVFNFYVYFFLFQSCDWQWCLWACHCYTGNNCKLTFFCLHKWCSCKLLIRYSSVLIRWIVSTGMAFYLK